MRRASISLGSRSLIGSRSRAAILAIVLALVASTGLSLAPSAVPVAVAASPDLTVVGDARYDVQPDKQRVHVTVGLTATNHKTDTVTTYYYFDRFYLQVLPGTRGFKATASGVTPSVRATSANRQYTLLLINLGKRLRSQQSMTLQLSFDLPDPGGAALRPVRIGQAVVNFPVWAYGTASTPGSSVSVVLPSGFSVDPSTSGFAAPRSGPGGSIVLESQAIADPLIWAGGVVADRPGAYKETAISTTAGATPVQVGLRSWTDDAPWAARVTDLLKRGFPVLAKLIGAPYPRTDRLVVQEAVSRTLGGYSGLFDPASGTIEVSYDASGFVVLHEASHTWFNGSLLVDRWANEGWASYYGQLAAKQLKVKASIPTVTPELQKARIPLNAWSAIGREADATEAYAYAATLALANAVAARAGTAGLQEVWKAAEAHQSTYQPAHGGGGNAGGATGGANAGGATAGADAGTAAEPGDGPLDWRGLLDALENITAKGYTDLWRTWVARPQDLLLLDARATARTEYQQTVAAAGDWELPRSVRQAMAAWQFDAAHGLLGQARQVIDQRAAVEAAARSAGLTAPPTLERLFEGDAGLRAASVEAQAELAAIAAVSAAASSRPAQPDPLQQLGLWGAAPETDLAAARTEFASGDLQGAVASAESARGIWMSAADIGRSRAVTIASTLLATLLVLMLLVATFRSVRRRRRARGARRPGDGPGAMAVPVVAGADQADPYATLAPDPPGAARSDEEAPDARVSDRGQADGTRVDGGTDSR